MVVSCKSWTQSDGLAGADSKKANKKKDSKSEAFYEIQFEDTMFCPFFLKIMTHKLFFSVTQVSRTDKGEVLHKTSKPLEVGDSVKITVDWSRRWDHMQQHSGQHLISAVAKELFHAPTMKELSILSIVCHVLLCYVRQYPKPSMIDLSIKELSNEQVQQLEQRVNEIIREGREMAVHIFHDEKSIEDFASQHSTFRQKPLPAGTGPLRVIEIEGVEYNTCCGTHLTNTRQMQMVKICSSNSNNDNGITQISFLSGQRILENVQRMLDNEKQITSLLTCASDEFVSNITKLQTESVIFLFDIITNQTFLLFHLIMTAQENCRFEGC
ncbi:alanyl-tRNA synthetase [Reticulomyxa filosa]|uniref:Alanyl-tRNA synthetase n=1 Tax=Reticulomyxa filosa TaxID=46433 RepID=X6P8F9_RETFI|nr:alanyl-tRNA synthetase [Reticulomyxa filosa]|eukprot:ETO33922.1 alanyl-tRNA synthetase [Reticulomyxa filosa]